MKIRICLRKLERGKTDRQTKSVNKAEERKENEKKSLYEKRKSVKL